MDTFFKKIGDDIASATEQAEIDATVERELEASIAEIEEQAEEEVEITPEDPGLEIADAGQRPEEMRTQEEIRDYNRRVIEVNNAIKERNLEEGNKPTEPPEDGKKKGAYGKRRRRKRKYGNKKKKKAGKKKKKAGKKKRKTGIVKGVKGAARNVTKTAKRVGKGATKTAKRVGKGAKKIVKRVGKGVDRIAKGLRSIFTKKGSFGRSTTPMPMYLEDYEQIQGYDPRELVMQSLFGKRKKKFGMCEDCNKHKFGKRRRYKFGTGCHGKETFSPKCIGQCSECGSSITGFDPMAIVQKKLSYGKRRRKRKFGGGCHCDGHDKKFGKRRKKFGGCGGKCGFGKKVSKKPSAATRRMCKRLKVRMTLKRGGKRVYKSEKMLKKQCKTAMKKKKKKTVKRRKRKSSCGSSFGKKAKKPSAALRRLCKKHKVRLTVKRGKKRVYKSEAMLKKQCKKAMKKKK
tara:strand:- start:205 stop:1578 length:1374 start_codon:yes stop_codon:yes gene_type:complete